MGYSDEAIIQMMNKHKRGVYGSIEDEICIRGKKICFRQDALFDNKMSVMLPDNFEDMSPEAAKSKYPMEQRPQVIKTSEDTKINFTFSLIEQPITNVILRISNTMKLRAENMWSLERRFAFRNRNFMSMKQTAFLWEMS